MTVNYDKRLNTSGASRVGGNNFLVRRWDYNQNTGWGDDQRSTRLTNTPITPPAARLRARGSLQEDGGGFQGDSLRTIRASAARLTTRPCSRSTSTTTTAGTRRGITRRRPMPDLVAWNAVRTVPLQAVTIDGRSEYLPSAPIAYFPKWFQWGQETAQPPHASPHDVARRQFQAADLLARQPTHHLRRVSFRHDPLHGAGQDHGGVPELRIIRTTRSGDSSTNSSRTSGSIHRLNWDSSPLRQLQRRLLRRPDRESQRGGERDLQARKLPRASTTASRVRLEERLNFTLGVTTSTATT